VSKVPRPRLVFAGTAGDSGKTLVCLGLLRHWAREGLRLAAFKKGPDYIDAAWLARASGACARNLDTFLMGPEAVRRSFVRHAAGADLSVIEGNRGILDGMDARGTHSTAALSRHLSAPAVLVLPATKTTRTAAAVVAGCRQLEPDLDLAGVVLNRVGGPRHERVLREAVESETGVPVLGALPRLDDGRLLPERHLGLVPPEERNPALDVPGRLADLVARFVDAEALLERARRAPLLPDVEEPEASEPVAPSVASGSSGTPPSPSTTPRTSRPWRRRAPNSSRSPPSRIVSCLPWTPCISVADSPRRTAVGWRRIHPCSVRFVARSRPVSRSTPSAAG
jgi:cobyrinic acid a,c-diamide synthase